MKSLLVIFVSLLTVSCGGYETLSTPFNFKGDKDINYVGANVSQTEGVIDQSSMKSNNSNIPNNVDGSAQAYEIDVTAPIGSVLNDAVVLFHKEARKLCQNRGYKHKITNKSTQEYVEYLRTRTVTQQIPSAKGIVICDPA
jgi:hypothetical protein